MQSDQRPLALGLDLGLTVGLVACRMFVVRQEKRILAEDRRTFAFIARHVDTPAAKPS